MNNKEEDIKLWIELHSMALLKRAVYLLSDQREAEDLVQEVFLVAFISYDEFKEKSNPKTWLFGILHHKVADFYRKKYKHNTRITLDYFFDETGSWINENVLQDWDDKVAEEKEFRDQALEECIEELPLKWKLPVKLYYLEEKKTTSVCQEIGITATNLWKILQRSRLQLRECLENNWFNQL